MAKNGGNPSAASRRYLLRLVPLMIFYLGSLSFADYMIEDYGVSRAVATFLAILPGLAFAGVFWTFGALIVEEKDEFFRLLYVRQGLIATGVSFTLAAIWGFLETYNLVEHIAAFWWPTAWCFGLIIGGVFNKMKYDSWGEYR